MRILGISARHSHILFGSLGSKPKQDIAASLTLELEQTDKKKLLDEMRKIPGIASRNHIFHSLFSSNDENSNAVFDKREISNGLAAKRKELSDCQMKDVFDELSNALIQLQELLNISDGDLQAYADSIHSK